MERVIILTILLVSMMMHMASSSRISYQQMLLDQPLNLHKHLHDSKGILRITVDNHELEAVRKRALSHLCSCPTFNDNRGEEESSLFEQVLKSYPKDVQQINLPDGTIRRTLASATVGFDNNDKLQSAQAAVLELPSWFSDRCGEEAYDSLEELRDIVADVTDTFVAKLDEEHEGDIHSAESHVTYRDVLANANHLEHFHVYTKAAGEKDARTQNELEHFTPTFDYHTDAGFFLSFVPAMNCHDQMTDDSSFYLKDENMPLTFEEDEVVILMGAGAQYWLSEEEENEQYPFLAASHALSLKPNTHRSWYGKMHLLPSSMQAKAFTSSSTNNAKYGDILPELKLENNKAHVPASPVDGCGTTKFESSSVEDLRSSTTYARTSRRRLQHVNSPANCNNVTNFFCWHQCIDIPNYEYVEDYTRDGYSLYCLDPSIMVSTDNDIPESTGPCKGGYAHNANCVGSWQGTDDNVRGYEFPGLIEKIEAETQVTEYPVPQEIEDQYCYGGTSMYMDGFHWLDSTCVILLFPSWVLSTPFKFGMACVGAVIFGILLELVLYKRRIVYALPAGLRRLTLSALVYGVQLSMGYFIMLIVMTYSGPLFFSCILGMVCGHVLFNAQDAYVKVHDERKEKRKAEETVRMSRLSSYQNGTYKSDHEMENGSSCCGSSSSNKEREALSPTETTTLKKNMMPSGATPCCQYTMEDSAQDDAFVD